MLVSFKIHMIFTSRLTKPLKILDTHLLTVRLPALIDLDLSDSQELTGRTLDHLVALKNLQHLGLSRCYSIEPAS